MAIGELAVNVTARTAKANKNIRNFRKEVVKVRKPVNVASVGLKRLGASLAAVAATTFTVRQFTSIADQLDRMAKTSSKLGISTDKLAGLRHAAEQTGVGVNTLDMSLQRMTRRVAEAAQGTGEAKNALAELGIDAQKLARMAPDQQFNLIADAMGRVSRQGDKVRLSMKLFDSEGVDLVNTLKLGSEGLNRMQKEAKDLGLAIDNQSLDKVQELNDSLDRLSKQTVGLGNQIVINIAPIAVEAINTLEKSIASMRLIAASEGESITDRARNGVLKMLFRGARDEFVTKPLVRTARDLGISPTANATITPVKPPEAPKETSRKPAPLLTNAQNLLAMGQGLKGIGGLFAGASNLGAAGLIGAKNQAVDLFTPEKEQFTIPALASRQRGSVDTLAASRRNLRGAGTSNDPMERVAKETVTANTWLEKIHDALAQGGAAIEALPIGGV